MNTDQTKQAAIRTDGLESTPILTVEQMSQVTWLDVCDYYSRNLYGGFTLLRFTVGWKAVFGTPHLQHGGEDYYRMLEIKSNLTSEGACLDLLIREGLVSWREAGAVQNARTDRRLTNA